MNEPLHMTEGWSRWRATDDAAQNRLIRTVEAEGLPHVVAPDGTLIVPVSRDVSLVLDRFSDTLFPEGWHRAEVSSPAVAERYRRFTARHGTTIVEEHSEGRQYFIQALREPLYRSHGVPTHASFAILSDELDPEAVTELLRIQPTFATRKGELFARPNTGRRSDVPPPPSRTGWWELSSTPAVSSNDVVLHLEWLLERLGPVADRLSRFSTSPSTEETEGRILQVHLVRWADFGGLTLRTEMLQRMVALCDRLDIGLWTHDSPARQE